MTNAVGIDFGTTKTMVSYFNPATGRVELVRLGRDRDSIPTTVHVDEAGAWTFGEDADDQIELAPEGYCRAFKLHLGERDPVLPHAGETAEALAARFLRHIREECERNVFRGEAVSAATITIPVSFSPARKTALKRAAEAAGFTSVAFLPEPEAAGTAFLRDNPADEFSRALVLDWGGGTLDIAIISRNEDGTIHADSHCAEGRDDVGGEEMDRLLLVSEDEYWRQTFGVSLIEAEENEPKLLREAEKVKIGLSRKETVTFRRGTKKVDVTREQFRQLIDGQLNSAVELAKTALEKNKKQGHLDPDAILLIGGTCQIPAVREAMEANFPNLRVLSWHHSHEAVALGASRSGTSSAEKPTDSGQDNGKADDLETALELAERISRANAGISTLGKKEADTIKKAAQTGDSRAAGILASIYHDGCEGFRKNIASSFTWAKKAAESGDDRGQAWLAVYYLGIDENSPVRKNRPMARSWAEKAYSKNKNLTNKALLMMVLASFDNPDIARIKRLGNGILKEVGDKPPDQFVLEDQETIGVVCFLLANLASGGGDNEKTHALLQKGAMFGNKDCEETLATFEQPLEKGEDNALAVPGKAVASPKAPDSIRKATGKPKKNNSKSRSSTYTHPNDAALAGAAIGAVIGTIIPGAGTLAGAAIGGVAGRLKAWWDNL